MVEGADYTMTGTKHVWNNSMPLMVSFPGDWDECLQLCKEMGINRVFLIANLLVNGDAPKLEDVRTDALILKERMKFFRESEIEVAYWGGSIGHGMQEVHDYGFQEIIGSALKSATGQFCPLDPLFQAYLCDVYRIIAETGVNLLILDDDFRQHIHGDPMGCFCPLHVKEFTLRTGHEWTADGLMKEVLLGKPTKWRKPWLDMMGETLYQLAGRLEQTVHAVNPQARLGLCSVMTHWSSEGVSMPELLKRLSGPTRPFLRTIGAPYWSQEPHHAGWIVEYSCLQRQWMKGSDVEIIAEGDTFPHNRFYTSASMLNSFHQGLRAQSFSGVLNYVFSYSLMPKHELGYASKLAQQREHYEAISRFIPESYRTVGVRPYYVPYNFEHIDLTDRTGAEGLHWPDEPYAIQYLARLGIPMTYSDDAGPLLLTGYNGMGLSNRELEILLDQGAVLDGVAATWLLERGIDIGITQISKVEAPTFEKFVDPDICSGNVGEAVWLPMAPREKAFYRCELQQNAKMISMFYRIGNEYAYPGVIHYEGPTGRRICILPFDFGGVRNMRQVMYNAVRQEQLARSIDWVGHRPLLATIHHHPDTHLICRLSPAGDRLVIALQNLNLDPLVNPVFQLNPDICINGELEVLLDGEKSPIILESYKYTNDGQYGYLELELELTPMGFVAIAILK